MARVVVTAGLAIAGTTAQAAVWNVQGQASVYTGYDDNVRLSMSDAPKTVYAGTDASLHLAIQNPVWRASIDPRVVWVRYRNYAILNRTENYLNASWQQQTETSNDNLSANWTRDTTLTSELGLTGLAETNKRHQSTALTWVDSTQWTERFSTQGLLFASMHSYADATDTGLVDYNYGSAQFSMQYALTPRSQISFDVNAGKLQVPDLVNVDKVNQSLMLSYNHTFAERWQMKISAGPSRVQAPLSTESGTVYEFSLSRKSEISSLQLKVARDITPTGQGILARREQWILSASRDLTERLSSNIKVSSTRNDNLYLSYAVTARGVRYDELSSSISWRCTPRIVVGLNAGYTSQKLQDETRVVRRRYASLMINWLGAVHTWH